MRKSIILAALVLFLAGFVWSAGQKETLCNGGTVMLLELAPVDPRALLMGDYMALRYTLDNEVERRGAKTPRERRVTGWEMALSGGGRAVVRLDEHDVARFVRLDTGEALGSGERYLLYRVSERGTRVAARSFFFQEGHAEAYAKARYGEIHVDDDGRSLLTHLLDADRVRIQPASEKREKRSNP